MTIYLTINQLVLCLLTIAAACVCSFFLGRLHQAVSDLKRGLDDIGKPK